MSPYGTSDDSSFIGSSRHQPTSNPAEGNSGRALAKSVIRDIRCHFLGRLTTCFVAQTPSSPLFKANFSESSSCSQESSSPSDSNSEGEGEEEHFQDNQDFELVFIAPSSKCFCPVSFMVYSSVCQLLVHKFFALLEPIFLGCLCSNSIKLACHLFGIELSIVVIPSERLQGFDLTT